MDIVLLKVPLEIYYGAGYTGDGQIDIFYS